MNSTDFGLLANFSLLEVSGADAERFLQGQLTCDVVALANHHWTLGACCNAKGRMVANFVIAKINDSFWLRLPSDNIQALKDHLARYIVFFKAQMTIQESWQVLGSLAQLSSPKLLTEAQALQSLPEKAILTWPDGRQECWQNNATTSNPIDDEWAQADIQQGLTWVTEASHLQWIPQEIEWDKQGGVSFSKGCYTGQEIVARLQFLGKSKKLWVQINSEQELELSVLEKLFDAEEKSVGQIARWEGKSGLAILAKELEQKELIAAGHQVTWQTFAYQAD